MSENHTTTQDGRQKHGEQFDEHRFVNANDGKIIIKDILKGIFDAKNIVATEPDTAYDNFKDEKAIHQILDYSGIDFVVDPFDSAAFGVNHRTHTPTSKTLRFDIRYDTGTSKPSELDELLADGGEYALLPRYACRAKRDSNNYEWVRLVELKTLTNAIRDGLRPSKTWTDGDVTAWMFDYSTLEKMGLVVYDVELNNNERDGGTCHSLTEFQE